MSHLKLVGGSAATTPATPTSDASRRAELARIVFAFDTGKGTVRETALALWHVFHTSTEDTKERFAKLNEHRTTLMSIGLFLNHPDDDGPDMLAIIEPEKLMKYIPETKPFRDLFDEGLMLT